MITVYLFEIAEQGGEPYVLHSVLATPAAAAHALLAWIRYQNGQQELPPLEEEVTQKIFSVTSHQLSVQGSYKAEDELYKIFIHSENVLGS